MWLILGDERGGSAWQKVEESGERTVPGFVDAYAFIGNATGPDETIEETIRMLFQVSLQQSYFYWPTYDTSS